MNNELKNFPFKRKSGILMPISSLPSKYGIGSFGKCAYDFVDFLTETKTKCWQILPLNPTSYGDSPYQSPASIAGNPYFIDLDILENKKLITKTDLRKNVHNTKRVDYGWLFNTRYEILRKAYSAFISGGGEKSKGFKSFIKKNADWIFDYSLFMALKVHYNYCSWTDWEDCHKNVNKARLLKDEFHSEAQFWQWVQYEFFSQWENLVKYAHSKGIVIIGDMPIYVAHDSMDVWQSPEQFLLDESYMPSIVAGCPPDDFSEDGQLWGNPVYNWELMELEDFTWWLKRIKASFRLYDILRIDHFRGFAGYYNIPYGESTAKNGKWDKAPGIKLFRLMKEKYPEAKIIAEDLGHITPDVRELLTDTEFPGMKMLQFAFFDNDNEYLPRMYKTENCVVYPASHDSDCIKSWYRNLRGDARKRFNRECPRNKEQSRIYDLIELALGSKANLAVVPMQDYLELSNEEGRMNTPSVSDGNWNWRLKPTYNTAALREKIRCITKRTKRAVK